MRNTAGSDASVYAFLQEQSVLAASRRLSGRVKKLGQPPYMDSAAFQRRASLLADLGTIERGKTFSATIARNAIWHDSDVWSGWDRQSRCAI